MRTHKQIIQATGADVVIARAGLSVSLHTVRSWQQRDAIPGEYWAALDRAKIAPLAELAHAAATRRSIDSPSHDCADSPSQDRAA